MQSRAIAIHEHHNARLFRQLLDAKGITVAHCFATAKVRDGVDSYIYVVEDTEETVDFLMAYAKFLNN